MLKRLLHLLPWVVTAFALWYVFKDIDFGVLASHISSIKLLWFLLAIALTLVSYLVRVRRWQSLFLKSSITFSAACKSLFIGFLMNNVLPARAGELVRAHTGAKLSHNSRTLVLATVANERLLDGVTLSLFFVFLSWGLGDPVMRERMHLVAALFGCAALGVILSLAFRKQLLPLLSRLLRICTPARAAQYIETRIRVFIEGLSPVTNPRLIPRLVGWSLLIWTVELTAYRAIGHACGHDLSIAQAVLFLVAVNFASLVPAAPGALGVIEAVASRALMSFGLQQEIALLMVLCQRLIQSSVVGIPGLYFTLTWRGSLRSNSPDDTEQVSPVTSSLA